MTTTRSVLGLAICVALALTLVAPTPPPVLTAPAYLCVWNGSASSYWSNPDNWSCGLAGIIPGPADNVAIVTGTLSYPVPYLDFSTTIGQLDINTQTRLIVASGVTLTTSIANVNGRYTGPGTLVVTGTFRWGSVAPQSWTNDGYLDGGGKIVVGDLAHGYISGYSEFYRMNTFTFENHGIIEPLTGYDYAWFELDNAAVHNYDLWIPNGTVLDASNNSTFHNHTGATLQVTKSTNLYTQFINDGTVSVVDPPGGYLPDATSLSICRGGTQTGSYNGTNDALLYFGVCYGGAQVPTSFTFALGSSLTTPRVTFYQPGHVHGTYGPVGSTSASYLYSPVTYYADATINGFGDMLSIYAPVTVLGTAPTAQYDLEVRASQANFSYGGTINVYHEFRCENNGKVSGGGLIRLMPTGTMRLYACTLDAKQVENQGTAYWYNYTVSGLSNATLVNKGTFNLYPGLLMTGTMTLRNEGLLTKNQVGTTTIAVPFENSGTVQILLGEVVFTHDVTLPVSSTTTIAGTLQVGELVNSGVLTVTGTVEGDLTNYGTLNLRGTVTGDLVNEFLMSPGSSPGVGVVTGSFTQTTAGSLKIELSKPGSEPVAAPVAGVDYDQLQIGGTAQLAGELSLVAGQTLAERPGEQISFLLATGGVSDTFETLELTEMIDESAWTLEYGAGAVAVRFADLAFVYLPLAVR